MLILHRLSPKRHLTLWLLLAFIASFAVIDTDKGILHTGGWATLNRLAESLLAPDFSRPLLELTVLATWQTLAYALLSLSIAVIAGFGLSLFAADLLLPETKLGGALSRVARAFLSFLRGIHELIWAWFFVAAVGLNPVGAVFALAIPYTGYLGKIFADTLQNVPQPTIVVLKQAGASPLQRLIYGYLPQALPTMLSYTLYRLECAIRSSSVLSFVGLGGIGMQIQLALQDLQYQQIWTFLLFLIGLMILVDRWGFALRMAIQHQSAKTMILASLIGLSLLMLASWGYLLTVDPDAFGSLFNPANLGYLQEFLAGMLGIGEAKPAYLDLNLWQTALKLSGETLLMSIFATGLATVAMLLFILPAARIQLGKASFFSRLLALFRPLSRGLFLISRAVPELMWAMILVFIFKAGVLAGALALALHNFGVLGKLCAELIENMDKKPLQHLQQNGASLPQLLCYGVLPTLKRPMLNYVLYRLENVIRASLIVGFVGASGLGMQFKLAMSFFHYSEMLLYLLCYLGLVYLVDGLSRLVRA